MCDDSRWYRAMLWNAQPGIVDLLDNCIIYIFHRVQQLPLLPGVSVFINSISFFFWEEEELQLNKNCKGAMMRGMNGMVCAYILILLVPINNILFNGHTY